MLIYIPMHRSDNRKPTAALFRASCRFYSADTINMFLHPYLVVFTFAVQRNRMYLYSRILYVQLKPFWRSLYHPSCARGFRKTNRTVTRVSSAHTTRGRPGLDGSHEMMPTEHLPVQAQFFFKDAYCSGDDTAMPKNLCQ